MRRAGGSKNTEIDENDDPHQLGQIARNVEIKARVEDLERTYQLVVSAADAGPETLTQKDTFFIVPDGRMKLREFSDGKAELIYYMRSNETGPTESRYKRYNVISPSELRERFTREVGVFGQVRKTRHVFWAGRTRIHLDDVDGLGPYLELEVVLEPDEPTESGIKEAESLMELLEINKDSLVSEAYVDLLNRSDRPNRK